MQSRLSGSVATSSVCMSPACIPQVPALLPTHPCRQLGEKGKKKRDK